MSKTKKKYIKAQSKTFGSDAVYLELKFKFVVSK